MHTKYAIMHNRRGYFIGRLLMGGVTRLSVEYFRDENDCRQALRTRRWTRRIVQ